MNRRDTILVAVLINVGLLVILFATAVGSDKTVPASLVQAAPPPAPPTPVQLVQAEPLQRYVVQDEVDQVLQSYTEERAPAPPTPVVAATPEPEPEYVEVTVKRGDNLDKIARANGTSIESLLEANSLNTTVLQIGQVLRVPLAKRPPIRRRISTNTASADVGNNFYTIQSGDNPWVIAMKYHIPLEELLAINNLDEGSARRLKPGDKIRVR